MSTDWKTPTTDITALIEGVIQYIPEPRVETGTTQMMITSLEYSAYIGRVAIGRVQRGSVKPGQQIALVKRDGGIVNTRLKKSIYLKVSIRKSRGSEGWRYLRLVGLEGFEIGDTVTDIENPEA